MATTTKTRHRQAARIALAVLHGDLPLTSLNGEAKKMFKNLTEDELRRIAGQREETDAV